MATEGSGRQSQRRRRAGWHWLHLWLGLTLGLPLALIGMTGSALVFWQEIDATLNPALFRISTPHATPAPLESALSAAIAGAPAGWDAIWVPVPDSPDASLPFHFYYASEAARRLGVESLNVFVDPGTARVIGTRVFYHAWNPLRHCLVGMVFKLHYAFFLKDPGVTLVGLMACALLASVLAGMVLWWPGRRGWRRALGVKRGASPARLNHDLHQVAGVYGLPVLLALLLSGIYFNLPDSFAWTVARFSPLTPPVTDAADGAPPAAPVALDDMLARHRAAQGGGRLTTLSLGAGERPVLEACFRDVPELRSTVLASRCLSFSRRSGELLRVSDPRSGTAGDTFMLWQWPLHSGQAFGAWGRGLVFVLGLACPLLALTGLLRYLQKRKAARRVAARVARTAAPAAGGG